MRRTFQIGLTIAGLSVTALSFAQPPAPRPGGPGGPGSPGGPPMGGPPNPQEMARRMLEMREQMLDRMTLTAAEKTAAKEALKTKSEARTKLTQQMMALQKLADDKSASESALKKSVKEFASANAAYSKTAAETDKKLLEKLSPRAAAQLIVTGFIGSAGPVGFGRGGGFRGGPGGFPGGPGGPGGRPGGPGGRPGQAPRGERTE
jgi:hypothetical protein